MKTIVIVTKMGKIIRFNEDELPIQKRGGMGIKPITLMKEDEIVTAFVISN